MDRADWWPRWWGCLRHSGPHRANSGPSARHIAAMQEALRLPFHKRPAKDLRQTPRLARTSAAIPSDRDKRARSACADRLAVKAPAFLLQARPGRTHRAFSLANPVA